MQCKLLWFFTKRYTHVTLWVVGAVLKYCVFRVKLYLAVNHLKQSNTMRGSSIIARAPPSCINEEHSATSVLFFAWIYTLDVSAASELHCVQHFLYVPFQLHTLMQPVLLQPALYPALKRGPAKSFYIGCFCMKFVFVYTNLLPCHLKCFRWIVKQHLLLYMADKVSTPMLAFRSDEHSLNSTNQRDIVYLC